MNEKNVKTVMIIDDDNVSRKKLVRICQRLGFDQIEELGQGDQALTKLREHPVDLVMADWYMPGLTGIDLLKAIRQDPKLNSILVFMVTNEGRQAQIISAIQAGASGYIMKPFSQESIKQKLSHLFQTDEQTEKVLPANSKEEEERDTTTPLKETGVC